MSKLSKGTNIIELVKMAKVGRKTGQITDLPDRIESFLSQRVLLSEWYPLEDFWELLRVVHEQLLAGDDTAAIRLGEMGAHVAHDGIYKAFIKPGDAGRTLEALDRIWPRLFNFGELRAELQGANGIRYTFTGYGDMPRLHGLVLLGWVRATIAIAGATHKESSIIVAPWESGDDCVIEATWS